MSHILLKGFVTFCLHGCYQIRSQMRAALWSQLFTCDHLSQSLLHVLHSVESQLGPWGLLVIWQG
jgi:hypothetical protein